MQALFRCALDGASACALAAVRVIVLAGFGVARHRWGCRSVWASHRMAGMSRWFLGLVLQVCWSML
ncbi:hypothetical protein Taro_006323 [Colocasia esculenta]|uniref:Uncharacterized protein n=1 Tax=Colocasia esculenta TaxID=4460 RepID=A0A843TS60_COLES|nr:hypothetical protein [Colocasia esculenta]